MGIEILLGVLVFPVAQKVGEKWIDRIATGIDAYSVNLLKQVISDPTKEQEVKDYFRDNPNLAEKVEQNIANTMQSDDIAASIAATVVPPPGAILKYYAELIRWLVRSGSELGRHFVLKGFLNGDLYLSYFIVDVDKVDDSDIVHIVNDNHLRTSPLDPVKIYVEKVDSTEDRDEKFEMLNDAAMDSQFGRLRHQDYGRLPQVERIHERYVVYTDTFGLSRRGDFRDLPTEVQKELRIATYSPIPIMIQSLGEQFEDRITLLRNLESAIKGATS
jgi:hypothetical protein